MIINEKPIMRLFKVILYSSNKTMDDLSKVLGLGKEALQRRGQRTKDVFTVKELIKICEYCGYDVYIEKPDIRINLNEFFAESMEVDDDKNNI